MTIATLPRKSLVKSAAPAKAIALTTTEVDNLLMQLPVDDADTVIEDLMASSDENGNVIAHGGTVIYGIAFGDSEESGLVSANRFSVSTQYKPVETVTVGGSLCAKMPYGCITIA